jgi:hypothetical protein
VDCAAQFELNCQRLGSQAALLSKRRLPPSNHPALNSDFNMKIDLKLEGEIMHKRIALLMPVLLTLATFACAQMDKNKRPSPPASASCSLTGGKSLKTDYSSPRMKGRKIYGGLVPAGEVWRAGANEATTFVTDANLTVGGKAVPAGSYTIFTVPNTDKWTLIINKKTGEWGVPYKYESDELARVDMKVSQLPSPVENFTISYAPSGGGCTLQMDWEKTRASVDISAQ